ncbi:MAG: DUF3347 domain-containing protein [Pedobacter sp.]|nr:MAG: DUF3347 domain-containing protein [Pedobacter sp.]
MKKLMICFALLSITITTAVKAQSIVAKREFNNTLKAYFDTKNALSKDNATLASTSVKTLISNIENFPVKTLSATQQTLWAKESAAIAKASKAISTEKAIKEQRKSFWTISTAIVKLAKEFNMNSNDVYVQYCPHAKKSWLSEVEDIQNPYYGSMMFACGEVTETIAKK